MFRSLGCSVGIALIAALALASTARASSFLKLDGLGGDSRQEGRSDWIEIDSVTFSERDEAEITRAMSEISPRLLQASVNGLKFAVVELDICSVPRGCQRWVLRDVYIVSHQLRSGSDRPSESFSLSYEEREPAP